MKFLVIFALSISFYIHSAEAIVTEIFSNLFRGKEVATEPLPREYPSLVLLLATTRECVIAPFSISNLLKQLKADSSQENATDDDLSVPGTKYLFVCPAENPKEGIMNDSSVTKQLLFIRDEYEIKANTDVKNEPNENAEPEKIGDVETRSAPTEGTQEVKPVESNLETTSKSNVVDDYENKYKCVTSIKPSFVNLSTLGQPHSHYEFFVTGFEVYMGKYENVDSSTPRYLKNILKEKVHWFGVLNILFHRATLDVKCVSYCERNKYRNSPIVGSNLPVTAADYELGKTLLYGNLDIEQLYTIDNQKNVFSRLFPNETIRNNYFNGTTKVLVKVHLAPFNTSLTGHSRQAAQTYGNIAPMWAAVKHYSWSRLNKFIAKLTTDLAGLHITTGTYEILNLASAGPIFLSETEQVSVPLAFYKIIEYRNENNEIFSMVIVVINNPYEKTDALLLCEVNECEKFGWGLLKNANNLRGETYCCRLTPGIITLLELQGGISVGEVLDLNKFVNLSEYDDTFRD